MKENLTTLQTSNDPYLNTARLTIKNRIYKDSYTKKKKEESFLQQKIDISSYLSMSKELSFLIFGLLFIYIPYILGIIFVFIFVSNLELYVFKKLNYGFSLFWAIGYEILASILLLLIIKSAFTFNGD